MTEAQQGTPPGLVVLWVSRDPEAATHMAFMYAKNSKVKGWWQDVRLVVWGPSAQLLSEDKNLQAEVAKMKEAGVELYACKACSDRYGVSEKLEELGCQVIFMGQPLTKYLKEGWSVLSI